MEKMKADISLHDNEEKMKELFMDIFIKKDKTRMLNRDVLHTDKNKTCLQIQRR